MSPEVWLALSQAERDAAYDNMAAVSDSVALAEQRRAASMRFRSARPKGLDLPYGPLPRQKWDLFPASKIEAPWLVFIHGGYWQKYGREEFAVVAEGLVGQGWSVALPGYTLAPEASLGQIVAEISQALDWLSDYRSARQCVGPVVLAGWSAGAQLAAANLGHTSVSAGLLISGVYDPSPLAATSLNTALRLSEQDLSIWRRLLETPPKPTVVAWGDDELPALIAQSHRYCAEPSVGGALRIMMPIAGANHFTILDRLIRPDGALCETALRLIQKCHT